MFLVVGSRFVVSLSRNVALDDVDVDVDFDGVALVGGLVDVAAALLLLATVEDGTAAAEDEEEEAGTVRDGDV